MMQKWMLGTGELTDQQAGDINDDGIINITDFCMLKELLIA